MPLEDIQISYLGRTLHHTVKSVNKTKVFIYSIVLDKYIMLKTSILLIL
jgi:hypothetical protein